MIARANSRYAGDPDYTLPAIPTKTMLEQILLDAPPITKRYLAAIPHPPGLAQSLLFVSYIDPDDEYGTFEIAKSGQPAVLTPIREHDIYFGDIVDVVAWHPAHDWVYTYYGSTTLGYRPAAGSTTAFWSVAEWFRAGCEGVVILRP